MSEFRAVTAALCAVATLALLSGCSNAEFDTSGVLSRWEFRCLAVSESMRTIGPSRIDRKKVQLARIDRLLKRDDLEKLDAAKLHSERAVLVQELEDAQFLYDCSETYYAPGSTTLRPTFGSGPRPYDADAVGRVFEEAVQQTTDRHRPHGFNERAALHTAEAAIVRGEFAAATEAAREQLESKPSGLYADTLELVAADAELASGDVDAALVLYEAVGKLPIGVEAHYARYRKSIILRRRGDGEGAEAALATVKRWADRGDREALGRWLRNEEPRPPLPTP